MINQESMINTGDSKYRHQKMLYFERAKLGRRHS
jgi:hypothetical protein